MEATDFLTIQDSKALPSLPFLVLYPPPLETKTSREEKSRIQTNLVKLNLVTQLSRFGILPSEFTTGKFHLTCAITPTVRLVITY